MQKGTSFCPHCKLFITRTGLEEVNREQEGDAEEKTPEKSLAKRGRPLKDTQKVEKREEMNIFKQIFKLNPYLKSVENLSSKEKYTHLKGILNIDFRLKPREIKEIIAVNSIRQREASQVDLKILHRSRHNLGLIRNSCGFVYLFNFKNQKCIFLNELVLGKQARPENFEKFTMKEVHLLMLPEFGQSEVFTASNFSEDALGKLSIVLASSKQKVYLLRYDVDLEQTLLVKEIKTPLFKTIECGENPYNWRCSTRHSLYNLAISIEDTMELTQIPLKEVDRVENTRYLLGNHFCWQHGTLFWLKDGATIPINNYEKPILDVFAVGDSILIVHVDSNVTTIDYSADERWTFRQCTKLGLDCLKGAAVSLNECLLVVLGQRSLFEETAELAVFAVGELAKPYDTVSSEPGGELVEILSWALKTFVRQRGNYTDIMAALAASNKLDAVRTMVDGALEKEEKSKQAPENVALFVAEVQKKVGIFSASEARLLLGMLGLAISGGGGQDQRQLRTSVLLARLRKDQAEASLLKSLRDGSPFECPLCLKKALNVDLGTLAGTCSSCTQRVAHTIAHSSVQHVPKLDLLCGACGVFHHPNVTRCVLCANRLSHLADLCPG